MKKVLFIVPSKAIGGTNSSLSSLINYLSPVCDIDVMIMCSKGEGRYDFLSKSYCDNLLNSYYSNYSELKGRMKLTSLPLKIIKRVFLFCRIPIEKIIFRCVAKKYQRKNSYDIVVGFSEGIAMKLASEFSAPIKYTWIHCEYDRAVDKNVSELLYYEKFNGIICVSNYTKSLFVNRYPSLAKTTTYIYNLIDVNRILKLSNEIIDDVRFNDEHFTIISVGRMDPVKQFSIIPSVADNLLQKKISFVWYIIGGPENSEYNTIKREIEKYGISKNVVLLGAKQNPYPYFKRANLYVSTSKSEACPMVFNEAKLLGIPIISTDFGSSYEFITDKENIKPVEMLAETIELFIRKYHPPFLNANDNEVKTMENLSKCKLDELFL